MSDSSRQEIRDFHFARFEVDFRPHQQLERYRLRPQLAANLDTDHVVMIERIGLYERPDLERARTDARLEVDDGLTNGPLEIVDVERRGRTAGQRRQSEIDDRTPCVRCSCETHPGLEARRV